MPEALAGLAPLRVLGEDDRRSLNQIRACSYLHLFDLFEGALGTVARERARLDLETREVLAPLLQLDCFDHHELFVSFESELSRSFPVRPRLLDEPIDLTQTLTHAAPLSLLVLALHLKLVTQQHYLACVRGDEALEPHFVRLLKDHWGVECGASRTSNSALAIQEALGRALPGRVPSALRDYRLLVFACDDVLRRQAELDVATFEDARGKAPRLVRPRVGRGGAGRCAPEDVPHGGDRECRIRLCDAEPRADCASDARRGRLRAVGALKLAAWRVGAVCIVASTRDKLRRRRTRGSGRPGHSSRARDLQPSSSAMTERQILVVDDEQETCDLLEMVLEARGLRRHDQHLGAAGRSSSSGSRTSTSSSPT